MQTRRARVGSRGRRGGALPVLVGRLVGLVFVLAAGTQVVTTVVGGGGVLAYAPVILLVAGVGLGVCRPYLGLGFIAMATPVAVAVTPVVTGIWSMACFAVLLLTLRGASAIACGAIVAVVNFAATALSVGTVDVRADPSASIAAFAAILCAAVGSAIHGNERYRMEAERRIDAAEASRAAAVERGVAQERLRIARDLHDSVGHRVAVVNMRLGAAEVHIRADPEEARADLDAARGGLQAVLRETQEILSVLRVGEGARLEPTPGHTEVRSLIESFRSAGMPVDAVVGDFSVPLSRQASVAVYRIVQEALTNAQKHGAGSVSARVSQNKDGEVSIEVANLFGPGGGVVAEGGSGLIGMRERAASVGGRLSIHTDTRLFWVRATIPADDDEKE